MTQQHQALHQEVADLAGTILLQANRPLMERPILAAVAVPAEEKVALGS
jgi:hypothetical protein